MLCARVMLYRLPPLPPARPSWTAFGAVLALAACTPAGDLPAMPRDAVPPAASLAASPVAADGLTAHPWQVRSLGGVPVVSGRPLTLNFGASKLSGSTGCNSYSAGLAQQGDGGLRLGPFMKGQRACDREADALERRFLAGLERVSRAQIVPGEAVLTLFDAAGRPLLEAVPG